MLRVLGAATPDEMVLAFLREIDSPDYERKYAFALNVVRWDRAILIDKADLADIYANCARTVVLSIVRGYARNDALFRGFPMDTKWRRVALDLAEFHRLRHVNDRDFWVKVTRGTRLINESARNYKGEQIEPTVNGLVEALRRGDTIPDIILVEDSQGRLVILDGNRRATACAIAKPSHVSAFLGTSPTMDQWCFV